MAKSDIKQQVTEILAQAVADIQHRMAEQGINASGRTAASFRVEEYSGGVRIIAGTDGVHSVPGGKDGDGYTTYDTAPIPTLEIGRPGGNVPHGFYYIIKQWTRDKGLSFSNERERGTFSYFLSRKIAREGTLRNKQNVDVYSGVVNNTIAELQENISTAFLTTIKETIQTNM